MTLSPSQDTGVSVRKRVIKILKDVCVLQPQFPRTSEICVKIMRRISDEEGIKVHTLLVHGVCEYLLVVSVCVCVCPATGD